MKITAGILLLVAAISNFGAGFLYSNWGNIKSLIHANTDPTTSNNKSTTIKSMPNIKPYRIFAYSSTTIKNIGYLMFIAAVIMAIGALLLLTDKQSIFILVSGGGAIVAELTGVFLTSVGIISLVGFAAGGIAIYAYFLPKEEIAGI